MYSEGFILALVGFGATAFGACLTFILRSRCTSIKCCCVEIQRQVLQQDELAANTIELRDVNVIKK